MEYVNFARIFIMFSLPVLNGEKQTSVKIFLLGWFLFYIHLSILLNHTWALLGWQTLQLKADAEAKGGKSKRCCPNRGADRVLFPVKTGATNGDFLYCSPLYCWVMLYKLDNGQIKYMLRIILTSGDSEGGCSNKEYTVDWHLTHHDHAIFPHDTCPTVVSGQCLRQTRAKNIQNRKTRFYLL